MSLKVSEHEIAFLTPCCNKGRGPLQDHRWGSPKSPSAMFVLIPGSGQVSTSWRFQRFTAQNVTSDTLFFCGLAVDKLQAEVTGAQRISTGQGVGWDRGGCKAPRGHHSASEAVKHRLLT